MDQNLRTKNGLKSGKKKKWTQIWEKKNGPKSQNKKWTQISNRSISKVTDQISIKLCSFVILISTTKLQNLVEI